MQIANRLLISVHTQKLHDRSLLFYHEQSSEKSNSQMMPDS